jgi:thioredoxin 1
MSALAAVPRFRGGRADLGRIAMFVEITDETFETSVAGGLSLVLFYKEQCPFCKAMRKIITKFSDMPAAGNKQIRYLEINSETNPRQMESLRVERIPSLFIFRDGQKMASKSGDVTYKELERMVAC